MTTRVECLHCNAKLVATEKLFGKRVKCPKCKGPVDIPDSVAEQSEATSYATLPVEDDGGAQSAQHASQPQNGLGCASCGMALQPDLKFCVRCGHHNYNTETAVAEFVGDAGRRVSEAREMPHELPKRMVMRGLVRAAKRLIGLS